MALNDNPTLMYSLVIDRTEEDVIRLRELCKLSWDTMLDEQKDEYLNGALRPMRDRNEEICRNQDGEILYFPKNGQRGSYNASDLNRVGQVLSYLQNRLADYGFSVQVTGKTDWAFGEDPDPDDISRYLADIQIIHDSVPVLPSYTPSAPESLECLTPETANDIEKILIDVNKYLNAIDVSWIYSGEVNSGEV